MFFRIHTVERPGHGLGNRPEARAIPVQLQFFRQAVETVE